MYDNGSIDLSVSDWGIEENNKYRGFTKKKSSNELLSNYMKRNITLVDVNGIFWEKFKYQVVISNLLDDGMILSKNDQAINHLLASEIHHIGQKTMFNDRYINLSTFNHHYRLKLKKTSIKSILKIIYLTIYLLKSQNKHNMKPTLELFRILLISSIKLLKLHNLKIKVLSHKILNNSRKYLILNCKLNRKFILYMIKLKNSNISNNYNDSNNNKILELMNNCLELMIFNTKFSIAKLLPFQNGDMLEKYCEINKIRFEFLTDEEISLRDVTESVDDRINQLLTKLNKFTQLRKLLISQFLIFDSHYKSNFFLNKLQSYFHAVSMKDRYFGTLHKLLLIEEIFIENNNHLSNFYSIFENFDIMSINESNNLDIIKNNENILHMIGNPNQINKNEINYLNLDKLVNKFSNLSTNLKYFQKYNESTHSNEDELNEKIMIFEQFSNDLDQIKELHHLSLAEMNKQLLCRGNGAPTEDSSYNDADLSLKTFHNSAVKKRNSLFSNHTNSAYSTVLSGVNYDTNMYAKKIRRQSPGLSLGLVKVIEENSGRGSSSGPIGFHESYNSNALDKLQNNLNNSFNRFSTNSVASNVSGISDLINLTEITSLGDENNTNEALSKTQLKVKLEENINKMYSKGSSISSMVKPDDDSIKDFKMETFDKSFLNQLDTTLLSMVNNNNNNNNNNTDV